MPVTVAKPVVMKVVEWDKYTGRFEAQDRVEIRARVSGFLESIHFKGRRPGAKGRSSVRHPPPPAQAPAQTPAK